MLNNLTRNQKIILLIVVILLFFYLRRNWWKVKKAVSGSPDVSNPEEYQEVLTEAQKSTLKSMAGKLKDRLSSWTGWAIWTDDSILYDVDKLDNIELRYLADYYNTSFGRNLKEDVDWLIMPYDTVDDRIYTSLVSLGF